MAGINWETGKAADHWPHLLMSLKILFTTQIGSRIMLRFFGGNTSRVLGENMGVAAFNEFRHSVMLAIELWEPRFRVHVALPARGANTPETMRQGHLSGLELYGEYRPRGHLGDPTPEGDTRRIFVGMNQSSLQVTG